MPSFADVAGFTANASADLFGGRQLQNQVADETDEIKKRKRLLQMQGSGLTATGSGSALGGLSVGALFGGMK